MLHRFRHLQQRVSYVKNARYLAEMGHPDLSGAVGRPSDPVPYAVWGGGCGGTSGNRSGDDQVTGELSTTEQLSF